MMNSKWILLCLLFVGCNYDTKPSMQEMIIGNWTIYEASRNNKTSRTMDNASYKFDKEGTMSSNLFETQRLYYTIKDKTIQQSGDSKATYIIDKLTVDTLIMNSRIGKYQYKFNMVKEDSKN